MGAAEQIKQLVPMETAARYYGFDLTRSGFMRCPFHQGDRTASLKVYSGSGGWHCFGCGKGGSVIDFVMELYSLTFKQAILRINADFNLGLSQKRPDKSAYSKLMEDRRREQAERERLEAEYRKMISDLWYYREILETFYPVQNGDDVYYHPLYVEAVKRIPYIEYWLDDYLEMGGGKVG